MTQIVTARLRTTDLTIVAGDIQREHEAAIGCAGDAISHALEVGRLLCEAKEKVGHGEWGKWVEENCSFNWRQANKYMQLHNPRPQEIRRRRT